jgi:hypothetical protein
MMRVGPAHHHEGGSMGLRKLNRAMNPGTKKRRQRFYRKEFPSGDLSVQRYWTWQATMRGYFGADQATMAIKKATRAGLRVPHQETKGD